MLGFAELKKDFAPNPKISMVGTIVKVLRPALSQKFWIEVDGKEHVCRAAYLSQLPRLKMNTKGDLLKYLTVEELTDLENKFKQLYIFTEALKPDCYVKEEGDRSYLVYGFHTFVFAYLQLTGRLMDAQLKQREVRNANHI